LQDDDITRLLHEKESQLAQFGLFALRRPRPFPPPPPEPD
jgi:hypothetical protein